MTDPVSQFLLCLAGIFLIGSLGELVFQRTNVPDVIWLILAGILLGPVGGLITRPLLASIAPYFAALTLVVVLFDGGSALKLDELRMAASRSSILALCTFSFSIVGIMTLGGVLGLLSERLHEWFAFTRFLPEEWSFGHGLLLASILGGSSSIIIMPAMSAAKISPKIGNLVNLESAVTDALCVVGTAAVIDVLLGSADDSSGPVVALASSFGIGATIGIAAGLVWLLFLRTLADAQHAYPITLAALLILYVIIDKAGGSAALGILAVSIILGNAKLIGPVVGLQEDVELNMSVRGFHTQMAFIVKSLFFVFIGAMLGPPWGGVLLGVLVGVTLLLVRIPAVRLAMMGSDLTPNEQAMVTVSLPRGMAAGVLATLPLTRGVPGTSDLPVIVFTAVLVSILIFAAGFPIAKKRLERAAQPTGASRPAVPRVGESPALTNPSAPAPPGGEGVEAALSAARPAQVTASKPKRDA